MKKWIVVALMACAASLITNDSARSEGAIAEGVAPGGAANGYDINIVANRASMDLARTDVMALCKKKPERTASGTAPNAGNAKARTRCTVVITFSNKCAAAALDPKDGTPGVGWALGLTQKDADEEAMARCRSVAGADRREFCKVTNRSCDGTAK